LHPDTDRRDLDHVNILATLSRTTTIVDLVKEIKRVSTVWMHGNDLRYRAFHWPSGYGVFSVSHSNIEQVVDYIATQAEHHRQVTFHDELRRFNERHDIAFDEKYLWD
jgi:putative transposase